MMAMIIKWNPLNLLPVAALAIMVIAGLIDFWVFIAIEISQISFNR
jgi:hypothetical protein